ncbi:MAG: hypothetical protein AAF597_06555, partial [Bacteroidota bacterium]
VRVSIDVGDTSREPRRRATLKMLAFDLHIQKTTEAVLPWFSHFGTAVKEGFSALVGYATDEVASARCFVRENPTLPVWLSA